ncbi:16S rRNA (cytosine(967)-C(5))-methyltransferase RsmB [Psittacicella gerlachiana]|uniref:16S rRNA (cytosine(967)-C(5))-methyltransferase n=1 Tax=Psittacicella gerlachiana TaxID=2028574 RepID=A0A3A1YNI6_9GAMM|nr:16S rRNA (cytosine(967)-C(5))-methyltransferase RsmB [Psittacicella gerlachiana]RIY37844.1 16S rRNA (cytosine(967)-C(5))-methyltransferase [Psittacicella gerlachiana]
MAKALNLKIKKQTNPSKVRKPQFAKAHLAKTQDLYVKTEELKVFGIEKVKEQIYSNPRFQASLIIKRVLEDKNSLTINVNEIVTPKDIGFTSELAYGVIRYLPQLNFIANKLLAKSFKKENYFAQFILLIGIYQILYMREAHHAAVYENVELCKKLYGKGVATVINACLRKLLRELDELVALSKEVSLLPKWLQNQFNERIPQAQFTQMLEAMNANPPLWLRVNQSKITVESFLQLLAQEQIDYLQHPHIKQAILLPKALNVTEIPGFKQGYFSVQDLHAQLASLILTKDNTLKTPLIVDTCCSPGGKTTHLLDLIPQAKMIATDIDKTRLKRVYENLERLEQQALVVAADARTPEKWLPQTFERLTKDKSHSNELVDLFLLDIPCSGSGVIRRHPDIKWLRTPADIERLSQIQLEILEKSWKYLKTGGKLLYTSCSILGQENEQVVEKFLQKVNNAKVIPLDTFIQEHIETQSILKVSQGVQLINTLNGGDGFYYCLLTKTA